MKLVNEQIRHILYGEGKVVSREADILSIQFSEQYGIKKFLYPDAFEKYLKLNDSDIQMSVLEELHEKQMRLKAEELQKQQEYEDTIRSMALEKTEQKKKSSSKSKSPKQKTISDLPVTE